MAQITKSNLHYPAYADLLISENVFETASNFNAFRECTRVKESTWVQFNIQGQVKDLECTLLSETLDKLNRSIYNAWVDGAEYGELKLNPVLFFVDRYIRQLASTVTYRASHIEYEMDEESFDQLYIYIDCLSDEAAPFYYRRVGNKLFIR